MAIVKNLKNATNTANVNAFPSVVTAFVVSTQFAKSPVALVLHIRNVPRMANVGASQTVITLIVAQIRFVAR